MDGIRIKITGVQIIRLINALDYKYSQLLLNSNNGVVSELNVYKVESIAHLRNRFYNRTGKMKSDHNKEVSLLLSLGEGLTIRTCLIDLLSIGDNNEFNLSNIYTQIDSKIHPLIK